jgi:hypothetical protein
MNQQLNGKIKSSLINNYAISSLSFISVWKNHHYKNRFVLGTRELGLGTRELVLGTRELVLSPRELVLGTRELVLGTSSQGTLC